MAYSSNKEHPWFEICHPRPSAEWQVFIFPAAGTAGSFYKDWDRNFPEYEFSIIIYPGRAKRLGERLLTTIKEYLVQLHRELLPYITKPCIFIGHSVGTVISFALARHMIEARNKGDLIKLLVEMSRGPPHIQDADKSFTIMTDAELVENLKLMSDPKSRDAFDYKPFVDMLIPILRADAKLGDVLIPSNPINIPIVVYSGEKEENLTEEFLNRWIELTTVKDLFRVRIFPGHHNFHSEHPDQVLQCLKEDFNQIIMLTKV
ncbi:unnamed protein product [Adineta ricciae]|uniref:oleoyl-[acyl-carrier-protein] hydrolase n=1 Tax=Adineta ricciae TaxID=249248 RepID=A0A814SJZ9_ADIRI|nr:unnamed protein product [Adineta ricciae]